MNRTLTEILKDADNVTELQTLIDLWNEIANNKYSYSLIEIRFANEHIRELALKAEGSDFQKGHFYYTMYEMMLKEASDSRHLHRQIKP